LLIGAPAFPSRSGFQGCLDELEIVAARALSEAELDSLRWARAAGKCRS
jgi:hypothetical protein